ncbi:uncharacterized protein LOC126813376 [Patella vulgata]|uniref:uncharacterized protein LOC126813376 n=1 Tax=Patella vulgata TaxID=6465 RepID=UPI00217F70CC|nr:uncharacterized protein LOC126813376 [Patella vulgata]
MKTTVLVCVIFVGLLWVDQVTCRDKASHLLMLEQPSSYHHVGKTKLEIRSNYSGTINFVESNEFRVLINTTANDLEEVYRVKADLDEHNGGLLLQVYEKPESVVWIQLKWIIIVIGGLTGLVFVVSCVTALCSYHSEHSRYDSIDRKSYTSDSQRIVFRSRSSMHSSTQGEHILNDDGDIYQNDDTLKRVPELPDEEAAAEAIEMEELRRQQLKSDDSDGESDTESKNLIKRRYQSSSKKIHKEMFPKEKKSKSHSKTDKEESADLKDYLEYSSDGSECSDKESRNSKILDKKLERQRIEGVVMHPRKDMTTTFSESEISRQDQYNKYSPFPVSASMEQNKLMEATPGLARTTPKENLGSTNSQTTDDGAYPFLVQADVHLQSPKTSLNRSSTPVATSSPMSTFKNPGRKVAFADPDSKSGNQDDSKSSINFQDVFDKFLLGPDGNMSQIPEENQDADSAHSSTNQSLYSGSDLVDNPHRLYVNIGDSGSNPESKGGFRNTRPILPPSLVAGARRPMDSSGSSLNSGSASSLPQQLGRNNQPRLNTFGSSKPWAPLRTHDQRPSLDSGITSSNGTIGQYSASSDAGNSSPPLPPPPDGYEEESGMQFDFPSPPQMYSPGSIDQEEVRYQNTPARDNKKGNGQRGGGKGSKLAHMTFLSITCVLGLMTGVYCVKDTSDARVDITIYTPRDYLSNTSTIFLNIDKDGEVINALNIPLQQYNIKNPILKDMYSDLCMEHDCEQGCDIQTGECICKKGYKLDAAGQCIDINECMEGGARCHKDAGCLNNKGSYNCICSGEFYGDGKNCRECKAPCVRGTYEYQSCDQIKQKICRACKASCPRGFFMNKRCDMKHNAECKVCKPSKCSESDFEYRMCTNRQDRECRDRSILQPPVGSKNTIIERLRGIEDDTKKIEYLRPSDFIGLRTYTFDRGLGLKVEVRLTSLQASQLFVPVNYSSHQSDGLPPGAKLEDFRRYCPHPVPSYYKLFYEKHRNITYRIDENNQVQPCETYKMFGKFPTARNLKEQSFLAVEPGPITNIFEINPTYFKYSTIWVHKSKRCMRYSDGCDNCTIQCVVQMKNTEDCKVKGDDNDNGWSPRLRVCYNCCARTNCTDNCKEYHKKHCQSKNVECRRGTVVEFRIQPQWNTSQANYFFCHVQPKKQQKLLKLNYVVLYKGNALHYKEIELNGDLKWETEGKMIHKDGILSILVDAKINNMPNFLEGEFAGNKELFRVGVYKNGGSTVQSTVINGQSILVRPTKPFGLVGISTGIIFI